MKKIILLLTQFLMFSCVDQLEINPTTEKVSNNFFRNEEEIESGILGTYAVLQGSHLYGLDLIGAGEVSGEDATEESLSNDGGRFGELETLTIAPVNDLVAGIWRESYVAIQRANTILNRITDIEFNSESTKEARIGEMKFVRGLLYFNLVRLYGDIPLVLSEVANPLKSFGQGKTSISEVYAQIEQDLSEAISELPLEKSPGRPAIGAAQALLADVYMTQARYAEALALYETIVSSGEYQLVPSTANIFGIENEGNSEVLFEVQFATGLDGNNEGSPSFSQFRPSGTVSNGKGHNLPSFAFVSLYDQVNDERFIHYVARDTNASTLYYTNKFDPTSDPNDGGSDFIVIRYSEIILKHAEALNETGQTSNAIVQLNLIRNRAGLSNSTAVSQSEVRNAIRFERRLELIGEGHRWFDLKRYGTAVDVMNAFFASQGQSVAINQNQLVLPIPQSQLDTDPAIEQNPGY